MVRAWIKFILSRSGKILESLEFLWNQKKIRNRPFESRGMLALSNCHVKKVIANNVTLHDDATVDHLEASGTVNRV
jgi:hypothetical protein